MVACDSSNLCPSEDQICSDNGTCEDRYPLWSDITCLACTVLLLIVIIRCFYSVCQSYTCCCMKGSSSEQTATDIVSLSHLSATA